MGQRRPETALPLRQARVIGRGQQGETATGHGLEALGGLHARQPPGRPAFAGEQGAGGAFEGEVFHKILICIVFVPDTTPDSP